MFAQSGARDGDMLTRTTLAVGGNVPAASAAVLIAALHRVPGVLLADWIPAHGRAVVAHDAAVPMAALVAAAQATGVPATVLAATRTADPATAKPAAAPEITVYGMFAIAAVLLVAFALVETFYPRFVSNRLVLPLLLAGAWAYVITRALVRHMRR